MNEKICCIASTDSASNATKLLDEIQTRVSLTIPLFFSDTSIANYEVVIFVLSSGSVADENILNKLKEASDLNRIFVPVILDGNWLKDLLLKHKYKGPNLRTKIASLYKTKSMLNFYSQLMSLLGQNVVGDPFGRVYTFTSDLDCKIIRGRDTIAELSAGQPLDLTLFLGRHKLKIQCCQFDCIKIVSITVDRIDGEDKEPISIIFSSEVKITSTMACSIYDDNKFVADINSGDTISIRLIDGFHKLKFRHSVHKNLNRFISLKINAGEDTRVLYKFPYSPKELKDE